MAASLSLPVARDDAQRPEPRAGAAPDKRALQWFVTTIAITAAVALSGVLLPFGRARLAAATVSALLAGGLLFVASLRLSKGYLVPSVLVFGMVLQVFWLLLFPVLDYPAQLLWSDMPLDVADTPYLAAWSQLVVPAGAVVAIAAYRFLLARVPRLRVDMTGSRQRPREMRVFLYVTAALVPVIWFAALLSGPIGYAMRIAAIATGLAPFIAGRFADSYRGPTRAWYAALAVNAAIGIVGGGRMVAFVPIVLYVAGVLSRLDGRRRRRFVLVLLVASVPLMYLSAKIAVFRERVGRGGLELFTLDRVVAIVTDVVSPPTQNEGGVDELIASQGLARMVIWPNISAVVFSPDVVPYRGFEDLGDEVKAYSTLAVVTGATAADIVDTNQYGQMMATRYGYMMDAQTAVNFGVLADGWSRGGALGAFGYGVVVTLLLLLLEEMSRALRDTSYIGYLVLMCNVVRAAMQVTSDPLVYLIRMTLLYVGVILAVLFVFKLLASLTGRRAA